MTKEELQLAVTVAQANLDNAKADLHGFESKAENNVFDSLNVAVSEIEEKLNQCAFEDCQGAGNRGADEYTQEFMVGDVKYIGTLKCEYNRHDKTYYYIEESEFTYVPA